jgi:hypothetical protein
MDCRGSTLSDGEVLSGCHDNALPSGVKSVANSDKDFAGIQIVRSAKGEAVSHKKTQAAHGSLRFSLLICTSLETNVRSYARGGWSGGVVKPVCEEMFRATQIVPVAPGTISFIA